MWIYPQYIFSAIAHIIKGKMCEAVNVIFDYTPMWATMKEKGVTQYQLIKSGIDNKTLDSIKKNKNITVITMEKLCRIIGCTPNDIVRFTDEPAGEE